MTKLLIPHKTILKKVEKRYVNYPNFCPFCESEDIEAEQLEVDDENGCSSLVTCNDCKKEWRDIYAVVRIEEVEA